MEGFKKEITQDIEEFSNEHRLSPVYIKKKLVIWCVRAFLSVIPYIIFWKYEWVRWTLVLYIPLTLFNLVMILRFNHILDKKLNKLRSKIDQ